MSLVFGILASRERRLLAVLLAALVAFELLILASGFAGSSGDDFFKAITTLEWSRAPSVGANSLYAISVLWLPLHFWVTGAIYLLTGHLVFSLTIVSLISHAACLLALYGLARLFFGRWCAIVSVLLVGVLPAYAWLGVSMTEMSWCYASTTAAFLFFALWQRSGRTGHLYAASLFFLMTTMLRPEMWVFAVLFAASVGIEIVRRRGSPAESARMSAAMVIPGLFIVFWLIRNWVVFHDPIYFIHFSKNITQQHVNIETLSRGVKALEYPFFMFLVSPILFLLIVAGVALLWRKCDRVQRQHVIFVVAQLAALSLAGVYGAGTKALPQRYVLVNVILLAPFAAALLKVAWRRAGWRWAVIGLLAVHTHWNGLKALRPPPLYRETVQAGRVLRETRRVPAERQGRICSELAFRKIAQDRLKTEKDFLVLASAHAALMVSSGAPDDVLFGMAILSEKEELMAPTTEAGAVPTDAELSETLRSLNVSRIVLSRREDMARVPQDFGIEAVIGATAIFSREPVVRAARAQERCRRTRLQPVGQDLNTHIRLAAAGYSQDLVPRVLTLQWTLTPGLENRSDLNLRLQFTHRQNPSATFERIVPPIFRWTASEAHGAAMADNIPLPLPPGLPPGEYVPVLSLTGEEPTFGDVRLPPVVLVSSKREVLVDFLTGRTRDWLLLWQTLISL